MAKRRRAIRKPAIRELSVESGTRSEGDGRQREVDKEIEDLGVADAIEEEDGANRETIEADQGVGQESNEEQNWADKVEADDLQTQSQSHWRKLSARNFQDQEGRLRFEEPLIKEDAQMNVKEASEMGDEGKNSIGGRLGMEGEKKGVESQLREGEWRDREESKDLGHGALIAGVMHEGEAEASWETPKRAHLLKNKQVVFSVLSVGWGLLFVGLGVVRGLVSRGDCLSVVNATYSSNHGKCFTCEEASVKLIPCASSQQALHSFCLLGKVVAPMVVNEATIIDFVEKVWKFNVTVVAVNEGANNRNCFELGFTSAGNRIWALENDPWCVRGYSFLLKVWEPLKDLSAVFNSVKIWLHIFNLPRDYFSSDNGKILGAKVGQVLYVKTEEGTPALWSKALKVLIRLNVNQPLFAGCYFGLESGSQRWIQFKYEKMGIFCYNCGVMGHQRRGCSLSSPITVASVSGVPFPMYRPWMSLESTYLDVFSGAFTFTPASTPVDLANPVSASPGSQPLAVTTGSKGHGRRRIARLSNQSMKVTDRRDLNEDGGKEVVQLPGFNSKFKNRELTIGKGKGPRFGYSKGKEAIGPAKSNSIESSICGQEVNFYHDEQLALTNFFQAQGTTLQELKKFGNLDLYDIKSIGGDIGVPTTSEVNERTTPFKKRKFDETTASLCSRPWKLLRPHPWVIRDFPWDTKDRANDTMESKEEPSEETNGGHFCD
ncbi:hypothetical protein F8388_000721 [Cannabis sativa]|uniref:CCHC-type domain-containing protein n=1 Tax=Cannabis sativa TaxID=3483 RepID=A0A7J6EDB1_CANSA|nr:hypothetical protein F8388_000721 [Cannabis sativa]